MTATNGSFACTSGFSSNLTILAAKPASRFCLLSLRSKSLTIDRLQRAAPLHSTSTKSDSWSSEPFPNHVAGLMDSSSSSSISRSKELFSASRNVMNRMSSASAPLRTKNGLYPYDKTPYGRRNAEDEMRGIFWKPGRKPQLSTFRPSVVDNPSFVRSRGVGFSQRLDGRGINLRTAQRPHVRPNVGDHGTGRQVLRERVRIHAGVKAAPRETASVEQASRRGSQDIKEHSLCGVQLACILELIDRTNHAICIDRELGMNAIKLLQNRAWGRHKGPRADSASSADLVVAMNALADFAHVNRRRHGEHLPGDVA